MVTATEVAQWMVEEVSDGLNLYQDTVVHDIASRFGDEFTYFNANGNLAIRQDVLKEFRKLTEGTVIWDKSERAWRLREKRDSPGRQQKG